MLDLGDSSKSVLKQQLKSTLPDHLKQMLGDKGQKQQCTEIAYIVAVAGVVVKQ